MLISSWVIIGKRIEIQLKNLKVGQEGVVEQGVGEASTHWAVRRTHSPWLDARHSCHHGFWKGPKCVKKMIRTQMRKEDDNHVSNVFFLILQHLHLQVLYCDCVQAMV